MLDSIFPEILSKTIAGVIASLIVSGLTALALYFRKWVRENLRPLLVGLLTGAVFIAFISLIYFLSLSPSMPPAKTPDSQYAHIAPHFLPAKVVMFASNGRHSYSIGTLPGLPNPLPWYRRLNSGDLDGPHSDPPDPKINHYLYFVSDLDDGDDSWTGFFFDRNEEPYKPLNADGKSELLVIAWANKPDILEIKLKDKHYKESMVPLRVKNEWAGYKIPLSDFITSTGRDIDNNGITALTVAHSKKIKSLRANNFKFAWFGLQ